MREHYDVTKSQKRKNLESSKCGSADEVASDRRMVHFQDGKERDIVQACDR
jgi:hypothetical protein